MKEKDPFKANSFFQGNGFVQWYCLVHHLDYISVHIAGLVQWIGALNRGILAKSTVLVSNTA